MSNEIEYIEPTQEHVGQMVEVSNDKHSNYSKSKLIAIVNEDGFRFVTHGGYWPFPVGWQFARIPRPLTYAERQARCGLKVGDRVRFVRAWEPNEYSTELEFIHGSGGMNREVGQTGLIAHIAKKAMRVQFAAQYWCLPYFVLEKVEDRVATQADCDKTVYVNGSPQDEFKLIFAWQEIDFVWRAVVRSGDKRFVYELSNLRVKE